MSDNWLTSAIELGASVRYINTDSNRLVDMGPGGNHATLTNGPDNGPETSGLKSIQFDGINQYAEATTDSVFDVTADWSVEWVMRSEVHPTGNSSIFHYGDTATNGYRIWMSFANLSTVYIGWVLRRSPDVLVDQRTPDGTIKHGQRQHIIMSYTGGVISLYVDGASVTPSGTFSSTEVSTNFAIGRRGLSNDRFFTGAMGPIFIYPNVALNSSQASRQHSLSIQTNFRNRPSAIDLRSINRGSLNGFNVF